MPPNPPEKSTPSLGEFENTSAALQAKLGYSFSNLEFLREALTHRSFRFEQMPPLTLDNERLEFLGDSVLSLILSDILMKRFSTDEEGDLSKKRASLVNEGSLYEMAKFYGLSHFLLVGKGEKKSNGHLRPRMLASSFEALIGAVYLDSNFQTCFELVKGIFEEQIAEMNLEPAYKKDFKSRLQEYSLKHYKIFPVYTYKAESGEEHNKEFTVGVCIGDMGEVAEGTGLSKKAAAQIAAQIALEKLEGGGIK